MHQTRVYSSFAGRLLLTAVGILSITTSALAQEAMYGRVVRVADGDTITVMTDDRRQHRVRLAGIDTPETCKSLSRPGQPFARTAKKVLRTLLSQKMVRLDTETVDQYGRNVAVVHLPQKQGRELNVNAWLVEQGLAWVYRRYNNDPHYLELERRAQQARRGIWSSENPVPPWSWRHDVWDRQDVIRTLGSRADTCG